MNALAARRRHPAAIAILLLLRPARHRRRVRRRRPHGTPTPRPAPRPSRSRTARSSSWPTAPPATASTPRAATARPDAWSASAPPRSTSRSAPAGCRWPAPGAQAQREAGPVHRGADRRSSPPTSRRSAPGPADPGRRVPRPARGRRRRQGRRALPHQLRDVPQLRRRRRRPDPRQVRARACATSRASTSTRPCSPARRRCRCSTTPTSPPRASATSSPTCTTIDEQPNPGGLTLGNLGPVTEGLFVWIFGLGALIGCAVWLGAKSA